MTAYTNEATEATETSDSTETNAWTAVCAAKDILPNTGVCALVAGRHVAIFRLQDEQYFAIDNLDPKSGASVMSRGLVGSLGELTVVAAPLYKQHYDLRTGACIESPELSVRAYSLEVREGQIWVSVA